MTRSLFFVAALLVAMLVPGCQQDSDELAQLQAGLLAAPIAPPATSECGGPDDLTCSAGQFCWLPDGACGSSKWGRCRNAPKTCSKKRAPVCGCDGVTYASRCHAAKADAAVAYDGKCKVACNDDAGCAAGEVCEPLWPGITKGYCAPAPAVTCESTCDCYQAGGEFDAPCPMMCPTCDNYWTCDAGVCHQGCGPAPMESLQCTVDCMGGDACADGFECVIKTECPACVNSIPACAAPCWAKGYCEPVQGPPEGKCEGDTDCPIGQSCTPPEACTACEGCPCYGTCEATGCYGDQDCPGGLKCNAGEVCQPPPGCKPGFICPAVCYGWCEGAP